MLKNRRGKGVWLAILHLKSIKLTLLKTDRRNFLKYSGDVVFVIYF